MKRLLALLAVAAVTAISLSAQTSDTTGAERSQQEKKPSGFIDMNGDGIDDRIESRRTRAGQDTDKFIDADGDGICDQRAGGMGFRKGSGGMKSGTTSPGKTGSRLRGGKR
jgi:hypothetical protein